MITQDTTPVLGTVPGAVETLRDHPNLTEWDGIPVAHWKAEAAKRYAKMGFNIGPLRGKLPRVSGGVHAFTNDPTQVATWWRTWPQANIGCRPPRGVVVIDIDTKNGGHTTWQQLTQGRELPRTLTVRSGSGGWHLWFKLPYTAKLRGTLGGNGSGIDLQSHRKYIVMPPSIHPNTHGVYLINTWAPPAPLPHWLIRHVYRPLEAPKTPKGAIPYTKTGKGLIRFVAEAQPRERNNSLFWAACRALEDGLAIEDELTQAARRSGLQDREIASTLNSARKEYAKEVAA